MIGISSGRIRRLAKRENGILSRRIRCSIILFKNFNIKISTQSKAAAGESSHGEVYDKIFNYTLLINILIYKNFMILYIYYINF
ncbi:MAG: hypothetical protein A2Y15_05745 [Clostridiales bacterium GWF2_36_10]|nr:MAG: hypothetical protein A2Y15_05745 [Clostridiales bacterium GWF2_36_10]HAN21954.1 hypothetical protein [Clostridiales bacterium]